MKKLFADKVVEFVKQFKNNLKKISDKDVDKCILKNE